jgi:hypothetical protein
MPILRPLCLGLTVLLATPVSAAPDGESDGVAEVQRCIERNVPASTSEQTVEFISVDRVGGKRTSRAKILAKRFDDGLRRVLMRFTKPLDLRGASLLIIETESGANDMFLYTPELRKVKRVTADGAAGTLFGTDFSYEDFERWHLMNKPGERTRLPDAKLEERDVYVLESRPADGTGSAYERIVSFVDQETCVVLKTESYERGERLRKVLTASPDSIMREAEIHVASEVTMRDVRDQTHTDVVVEDLAVDREIEDTEFAISRLSRRR